MFNQKEEIFKKWLEEINCEFTEKNIPHKQRPFEALRRLAIDKGISTYIGSELSNMIFDWFKKNTKDGVHNIGTLFSSTYFYDCEFWELEIFVFFGTVRIDPFNSLTDMPPVIKKKLSTDPIMKVDYLRHWADCFDFSSGFHSIRSSKKLNSFGQDFMNAGFEELNSAVTLLRTNRLNPRAIMDSRMAVEMFFKSYAALHNSLTEKEAKRISHCLEEGLEKMIYLTGQQKLEELRPKLAVYPEISNRYKAQTLERTDLWTGFHTAQTIGAIVTRQFSDYNILSDIEKEIKKRT